VFGLRASRTDGVARRTCRNCGAKQFIADSNEFWAEATPRTWKCICRSKDAYLAVGFSLYEDHADIRWISLGHRCAYCGIMGSCVDWKIAYGPSLHLLDQA
jgi:hypothetical protein